MCQSSELKNMSLNEQEPTVWVRKESVPASLHNVFIVAGVVNS